MNDRLEAFEVDDTSAILRDSVGSFLARGGLARARDLRWTKCGLDVESWRAMGSAGWLGAIIPEEYGGLGLGYKEVAVIALERGRWIAPEPLVECCVFATEVLLRSSNEAAKLAILPQIAAGEKIVAVGFQGRHPGMSLDSTELVVSAGRMKGTAYHVYPALCADDFLVAAKANGKLGIYRISAAAPGITLVEHKRADGSIQADVTFDAVNVYAADLLLEGDEALAALAAAFDVATVIHSAMLVGVMSEALDITLRYMNQRVQFGKVIGTFQALQHRAADLFIHKELAVAVTADAVRKLDEGVDANGRLLISSRAKSRAGDAATMIGRETIKLHGAIGVTDECDIGLFMRRGLVLTHSLGTPIDHRRRYSSALRKGYSEIESSDQAVSPPAAFLSDDKEDVDWNAFSDDEFRSGIRAYLEANYPKHLRHLGRRGSYAEMSEWLAKMARKGWIAPAWPVEYGGMGLSPAKQIVLVEERGRVGIMQNPDQGIVHLGPILIRYGTDEQKRKYLPKILSSEHIWCQGYSEPNAGSDLASLKTEAVLDGDHFVINGSKIWTTWAAQATHMFVLARTSKEGKPQDGISFLLVPLNTPGITIRPIETLEGYTEFCQEFFDNVRIPKENLVGSLNQGWKIAKSLLGLERLNNGSPRRTRGPLQALSNVAKEVGVWDDEAFQFKYTQVYLDIADQASNHKRFSDIVRSGGSPGPEMSQLKIWASETTQRVTELLVETAGPMGTVLGSQTYSGQQVSTMSPFFTLFTSAIGAGTNDIQRNITATRVLNLPK